MSQLVLQGVSQNMDLSPNLLKKPAALPAKVRRAQFFKEASGFLCFLTVIPIVLMTFAYEAFFVMGILFYLLAQKHKMIYEIETPLFETLDKSKKNGKGILLVGRDRERFTNLFIGDSLSRQHFLVMGSTGSGKTRFLMSILYQSMVMGSGCMYVDGKADNTVFWLVFSLCQRLDRIDDFVVINYLTTEGTLLKEKNASIRGDSKILTNTMNPYSTGDSEQLRSMTVGLMRDSGGDGDMWKGRASSLLSGTMRFLTYLRAIDAIQMSVLSIRDSMPLDNVLRIVHGTYNGTSKITIGDNVIDIKEMEYPDYAIRPLKKYLADLPGYTERDAENDEIDAECYKQHGFLTMQLTEALSDLSETYGHIFNAPIGEVDFNDLIYSRRVLFVMLPALQRDPDALANLGKMIVATIRSALGPALGSEVEGMKSEVIDQKATNSDVPYYIILDEYGYYSVKGFAIVAAQARSLGISVIFAGQDYASFKKGNADEAQSVIANTNIKIGMKLEEKETVELFVGRGGKKRTPMIKGQQRKQSDFSSGYKDTGEVSFEEVSVINENDIYDQGAGKAHIIIGSKVYRVDLFALLVEGEGNGTTHEVEGTRLNRFLMVRPPKPKEVQVLVEERNRVKDIIFNNVEVSHVSEKEEHITSLIDSFRNQMKNKNNVSDSAMCSIGSLAIDNDQLEEIKRQNKVPEKSTAKSGKEVIKENEKPKDMSVKQDENIKDHVGLNNESSYNGSSLAEEANKASSYFENLIDSMTSINGKKPMRRQLEEVATDYLGDEEAGKKDAEKSIAIMEEKFNYPVPPNPKKQSSASLKSKLSSLTGKLHEVPVKEKEDNKDSKSEEDISDLFNDEQEEKKTTSSEDDFDDEIPFN